MTVLALFAGLALLLVALAALPFVSRSLRSPTTEIHLADDARGRRVRGRILIGIFLLGYPIGEVIERARTRDNAKADRKADEVAANVVALAEADRSKFIRGATALDFEQRRILVEELHLKSATGNGLSSATTFHQVEVGWATRCVRGHGATRLAAKSRTVQEALLMLVMSQPVREADFQSRQPAGPQSQPETILTTVHTQLATPATIAALQTPGPHEGCCFVQLRVR